MIRSLAVNGFVERSIAPRRGLRTYAYPISPSCAVSVRRSFPRAASTSTSTTPSPSSDTPLDSNTPRKFKADFHPAPMKGNNGETKPVKETPDISGAGSSPSPSPLRAVAKAEAVKAHAYNKGKAVEQMSTFQMMKFDVQDAIERGIMKAPPQGAGAFRIFRHNMWEVLKFYGRGIRQINEHRILANEMTRKSRETQLPLTRSQTRFVSLYKRDAIKLIPFVMIAVVLEEIIPLLVLYAPFMLPSTCILPSQAARITRARHESQLTFSTLRDYFEPLRVANASKGFVSLTDANGPSLQALCGILGLSTFGPPPIRRWRLSRKLTQIAKDDAQLRAEGSGEQLSKEDLVEALQDRGITTDTIPPTEWNNKLRWWLQHADGEAGDPVTRRLLLVATIGARRW